MPAAAVIPAPIAYIKVVAVKKLVVGFAGVGMGLCVRKHAGPAPLMPGWLGQLSWPGVRPIIGVVSLSGCCKQVGEGPRKRKERGNT